MSASCVQIGYTWTAMLVRHYNNLSKSKFWLSCQVYQDKHQWVLWRTVLKKPESSPTVEYFVSKKTLLFDCEPGHNTTTSDRAYLFLSAN